MLQIFLTFTDCAISLHYLIKAEKNPRNFTLKSIKKITTHIPDEIKTILYFKETNGIALLYGYVIFFCVFSNGETIVT